jgi:hypothetical protein
MTFHCFLTPTKKKIIQNYTRKKSERTRRGIAKMVDDGL